SERRATTTPRAPPRSVAESRAAGRGLTRGTARSSLHSISAFARSVNPSAHSRGTGSTPEASAPPPSRLAVAARSCHFPAAIGRGGGRVRRLAAVAATTLGLVLGVAAAHGQRSEPGLAVRNVRVERIGGGRRVTVTLTHPPEGVRGSRLDNPLRLEIDIDSPQAEAGGETRFPVAGEVVSGVRAAPRAGGLSVVLDLKRDPGPAAVRAEGAEVIADLGEAYVSRAGLGVGLGGKR